MAVVDPMLKNFPLLLDRDEKAMNTQTVKLGYVILFVKDVSASLGFYEQAFGLSRRFFSNDTGSSSARLFEGLHLLIELSLPAL